MAQGGWSKKKKRTWSDAGKGTYCEIVKGWKSSVKSGCLKALVIRTLESKQLHGASAALNWLQRLLGSRSSSEAHNTAHRGLPCLRENTSRKGEGSWAWLPRENHFPNKTSLHGLPAKEEKHCWQKFCHKFVDQGTLSCLFEIHYSLSHLGNGKNLMISNRMLTPWANYFYNQLAYQVIHKQKNQPSAKGKIFA